MDCYNRQKIILILISKKNIANIVRSENSWGLSLEKIERFSNPAELQLNVVNLFISAMNI